jgi:hypothetical protein
LIIKGVSDIISNVVVKNIDVCFVENIVVSVIVKVGVDELLSVVEVDIDIEDVENIEVFIVVLGLEEINENLVVRMFVDSNVDRDVTNVLFRLLSLCDDIITVGEVFSVVCLSLNFVLGLEYTDEEIISVGGVLSVVEADIKVEDVKNIEVFIVVLGLEEVNETHVVRMFVDSNVDRDVTNVLFRLLSLCDDIITVGEVFSVVCLSVNFVLGLEITDEEIISVGGVLSVVEADIKVEDVKKY